ncbi:hypothetical protein BC831DRAFT_444413 [Entophlyctis helioformis]|nr:hypothetical protein BC831DRAFT_444413 [Entophlyctis helioformis]
MIAKSLVGAAVAVGGRGAHTRLAAAAGAAAAVQAAACRVSAVQALAQGQAQRRVPARTAASSGFPPPPGGFGAPGQPSPKDMERLAREFDKNPALRSGMMELIQMMQRKGIDIRPGQQPSMSTMMKLLSDGEVRAKLMEIAKMLQAAGFAADASSMGSIGQLLTGGIGGGGAPPAPPSAPKTIDSKTVPQLKDGSSSTSSGQSGGIWSSLFGKKK